MDEQFKEAGEEAGFNEDQLEFMWQFLVKEPHTHDISEIYGLEEALEENE